MPPRRESRREVPKPNEQPPLGAPMLGKPVKIPSIYPKTPEATGPKKATWNNYTTPPREQLGLIQLRRAREVPNEKLKRIKDKMPDGLQVIQESLARARQKGQRPPHYVFSPSEALIIELRRTGSIQQAATNLVSIYRGAEKLPVRFHKKPGTIFNKFLERAIKKFGNLYHFDLYTKAKLSPEKILTLEMDRMRINYPLSNTTPQAIEAREKIIILNALDLLKEHYAKLELL